jgi:hypothetical protein
MKNYNSANINFLWAHNRHVSNLPLSDDNLNYIKNKNHKWFCGYYLKKKLKDNYCIILSQAYEGENRFNGYCIGNSCDTRTWQLNYIYKNFKYNRLKKYVKEKKVYQLLTEYDELFISFSNSYYKDNKYGVQSYDKIDTFNYILFWNKVSRLE